MHYTSKIRNKSRIPAMILFLLLPFFCLSATPEESLENTPVCTTSDITVETDITNEQVEEEPILESIDVDESVAESMDDELIEIIDEPEVVYEGEQRSWFKRMFCKPEWEQILVECDTPKEICKMINKHIGYREEQRDSWSAAHDTWERGKGDCEDFAICVQELCQESGFDANIHLYYSMKNFTQGHAVVVGVNNGQLWLSSNGSYTELDSMDEANAIISRVLWCDKKDLCNRVLANDDVDTFLASAPVRGVSAD